MMTLFQPTTGQVRVKGVTSCANKVLHPWLKQELSAVLATLPAPAPEGDRPLSVRLGLSGMKACPHRLLYLMTYLLYG